MRREGRERERRRGRKRETVFKSDYSTTKISEIFPPCVCVCTIFLSITGWY